MRRAAKGNLVIAFLILLLACASAPPAVERRPDRPGDGRRAVYVIGHGWHTGIVMPAEDFQVLFPALGERFGDIPYIEFGWGDQGFYQAEKPTLGLSLTALLWPTRAVMHAVAVPADVQAYFPGSDVRRLCLSQGGYDALLRFIAGSFRQNEDGRIFPLGRGLYGDSSFYEALGGYSLFNTCNTWTARALKSAGLDINPAFKATAGSVMRFMHALDPAPEGKCAAQSTPAG